MKSLYRIDAQEVRESLSLVLQPGQVTELRAMNCRIAGEYRTGTYSGYYCGESIDSLISDLNRIESASACYFVPNPVKPELHARRYNTARILKERESSSTSDHDILRRDWLLIDCMHLAPLAFLPHRLRSTLPNCWSMTWRGGCIAVG